MTISAAKTTTKPTIEESLLPPKIMTALSMVASGTSYELAAKSVNMTAKQLRKWNKHKDTKDNKNILAGIRGNDPMYMGVGAEFNELDVQGNTSIFKTLYKGKYDLEIFYLNRHLKSSYQNHHL